MPTLYLHTPKDKDSSGLDKRTFSDVTNNLTAIGYALYNRDYQQINALLQNNETVDVVVFDRKTKQQMTYTLDSVSNWVGTYKKRAKHRYDIHIKSPKTNVNACVNNIKLNRNGYFF